MHMMPLTRPTRGRPRRPTKCCSTLEAGRLGGSARILLAVALLLAWDEACDRQVRAEPGRLEFGAELAPSWEKHAGERPFAENTYKLGASAGAWLRYGLLESLSLQPEVVFATRGSHVKADGETINGFNFRYLQVPVLVHYGYRIPGLRTNGARQVVTGYVVAGPALSILLDAENIDETRPLPLSDLSRFDLGVTVGLGAAWRIAPRWTASLELRFDRGFVDAFTTGVESKNQAILLALGIGYTLNDRDADGLADPRDRCPTEAEDWNGYDDADGCPDADNDGDGIPVGYDRCVEEPEDRDGFADEDGCPDPDNDGDGFLDDEDECPTEAFSRMRGCPPRFERVRIEDDHLVLTPRLEFDVNSAVLADEQKQALNQVAELLADYYPNMWLRLEGHADGEGRKDQNQKLSDDRARAVADYLVGKGIDRDRLVEKGYGEDRPIRREEAEAGKRRNRRVELVIIEK